MDVLVFKTNIIAPDAKPIIGERLMKLGGIAQWSIDFSDRDKVLRVESDSVPPADVVKVVNSAGFLCEELV